MSRTENRQPAGLLNVLNTCAFSVAILNLLQALIRLPELLEDPTRIEKKKLPSSWITSCFLALMRYCSLRSFANDIRRNSNGDVKDRAEIPGTDWYFVCGEPGFVHLANGVTRELAAAGAGHAWSDPIWVEDFIEDVDQVEGPPSVYRRAKELFPDAYAMRVALEYLQQCGVLQPKDDRYHDIELSPDLQQFRDVCERFAEYWADADDELRVLLARIIGDCDYVNNVAPTAESKRQAEECKEEWAAFLRDEVSGGLWDAAIPALGHLGELEPFMDDILSNASMADAAIPFFMDDPQYLSRVSNLYDGSACYHPVCARYLLKHGYRVHEVLMKLGSNALGNSDAIDLAFEYAPEMLPEMLPELLHQGIRFDAAEPKEKAAAVLVLLNHEWCRQELISVLSESSDWGQTFPIRSALHASEDPAMREFAEQWEGKHSDSRLKTATTGPPLKSWMVSKMADAVLNVRDRVSDH